MRATDEIMTDEFPYSAVACAGFAGSTLYLVAREPGGAANDRDELAADEHGYLLYVADGCVWRYTESGAGQPHEVVCGPHR